MSLEIRRAEPHQVKVLTAIAFAAKRHWKYPESWIREWASLLTITAGTIASLDVWCAQLDGEIAGFHSLSCHGERASLEHLWVLPRCMRQGVGRALFEHAVQTARTGGCELLEIESDPNAREFYERMGAVMVRETVGEIEGRPRVLPVLEMRL